MIFTVINSIFSVIGSIFKAINYIFSKLLLVIIVCMMIVIYPIIGLVNGFDWLYGQARKLFVAIYYV